MITENKKSKREAAKKEKLAATNNNTILDTTTIQAEPTEISVPVIMRTADRFQQISFSNVVKTETGFSFTEIADYGLTVTDRTLTFKEAFIYDSLLNFSSIKNAVYSLFTCLQNSVLLTWDIFQEQGTLSIIEDKNGFTVERVVELAKVKSASGLIKLMTDKEKTALAKICENFCKMEFNGLSTFV